MELSGKSFPAWTWIIATCSQLANRETFIMLVLYMAIYMYVFIVLFYSFCMHGRVTINVQDFLGPLELSPSGCHHFYEGAQGVAQ